MTYIPNKERYQQMVYNRCGKSGLILPAISLGLWQNFGFVDDFEKASKIILKAFDSGITHFDLANNYGPPPGSAELNFGKILADELKSYRDELIISTKAGYTMWQGPYGDWGSKKYLVASLDQSLKRMGLDYVDIFYHHRLDPNTPLEETMAALDLITRQGKALYIGLSNYPPKEFRLAVDILEKMGNRCLIHQPKYSMFVRTPEEGLFNALMEKNVGCIPFSPLAQGLLTNKYLNGIPTGSRAAKSNGFLKQSDVTEDKIAKIVQLNKMAKLRNQTLAQMAIAWVLRNPIVTSVLVGASSTEQLEDSMQCLQNKQFSHQELLQIDSILG
jgi:L-glyceraldehyde 3-phosphate reductase